LKHQFVVFVSLHLSISVDIMSDWYSDNGAKANQGKAIWIKILSEKGQNSRSVQDKMVEGGKGEIKVAT